MPSSSYSKINCPYLGGCGQGHVTHYQIWVLHPTYVMDNICDRLLEFVWDFWKVFGPSQTSQKSALFDIPITVTAEFVLVVHLLQSA